MSDGLKIRRSLEFVLDQLKNLPEGEISVPVPDLKEESMVVSLTEGWRGEISHIAITG